MKLLTIITLEASIAFAPAAVIAAIIFTSAKAADAPIAPTQDISDKYIQKGGALMYSEFQMRGELEKSCQVYADLERFYPEKYNRLTRICPGFIEEGTKAAHILLYGMLGALATSQEFAEEGNRNAACLSYAHYQFYSIDYLEIEPESKAARKPPAIKCF